MPSLTLFLWRNLRESLMLRLLTLHGKSSRLCMKALRQLKLINNLQQLTSRFESIRMSDDEFFDELYAKLNDIVNSAYNLGKIYDQPKIVRKILKSLTENFRPKVTVITESKDVDFIPVDELVGSF